jgi:hypothetical protein
MRRIIVRLHSIVYVHLSYLRNGGRRFLTIQTNSIFNTNQLNLKQKLWGKFNSIPILAVGCPLITFLKANQYY